MKRLAVCGDCLEHRPRQQVVYLVDADANDKPDGGWGLDCPAHGPSRVVFIDDVSHSARP